MKVNFSNLFEIYRNILNIQPNIFINLDDDAPLTRKEAKTFFNELKKEISDVRKLLEMSGVGDFATDEAFIKVIIICEIFLKMNYIFYLFGILYNRILWEKLPLILSINAYTQIKRH